MRHAVRFLALLLATGLAFGEGERKIGWQSGTLRKGAVAIGGETTGWQLDKLDVKGDDDELAKHEGKRVAVYGETTMKEWVERGPQPLLTATKVMDLEAADKDLKIVGSVELANGVKGTLDGPVLVGVLLVSDDKQPGPERHFVKCEVTKDMHYELVLPAPAGNLDYGYQVVAWVDADGDGVMDLDKDEHSTVFAKDDGRELFFHHGVWTTNGRTAVTCTSPFELNLRVEAK